MSVLTYNQAKKLIEMEILAPNSSHLIIWSVSLNDIDEYMIDKIIVKDVDILLLVSRVKDLTKKIVSYKLIRKIGDMSIDKVMTAYNFNGECPEEIDIETDVIHDLIGKPRAIIDGIEMKDGMKVIFENDITEKYNDKVWRVKLIDGKLDLKPNRGRPKKARDDNL